MFPQLKVARPLGFAAVAVAAAVTIAGCKPSSFSTLVRKRL